MAEEDGRDGRLGGFRKPGDPVIAALAGDMDETKRWIIHLDMDAFYASVEVLDNPSLRGKPVIVAGLAARGVVCAASYEARRFGVRSALPTQQARLLCRQGVFIRPRMARYRELSHRIFTIIREFSDQVEPVSVDECYVEVVDDTLDVDSAVELARALKERIRDEIGLTASIGLAPNKFIAKIASDMDKPDGLVVVEHDRVEPFLSDLPVKKIPGIGPATQRKLLQYGIEKISELRRLQRSQLERLFGKAGGRLYECARGIDERPVVTHRAPKSLSREKTFEKDTRDQDEIRAVLRQQSKLVAQRLSDRAMRARAVEIKIKYGDFIQVTRRLHLDDAFDDTETIYRTALTLLHRTEAARRPVRLVGVGVVDLIARGEPEQLDLFD